MEWTFLGCSFLHCEDGSSWFVSPDGVQERRIRLRLTGEGQGAIVNALDGYIARYVTPEDKDR